MTASAQAPTVSEANRERAAAEYDRAVHAFERRDFHEAARRFLAADELAPNSDSLLNAIVSARHAREPLLLAEAAERGVSRENVVPSLARNARAALEEADRQLARVVIACRPEPCEIDVDGARVSPGRVRLLPGSHVVGARAPTGERSTQVLDLAAGEARELSLETLASPSVEAVPPAPAAAVERPAAPSSRPPPPAPEPAFAEPLFYAGLGTTVALAAATTWSGIDALHARSELPGTQEDNDAVMARAHRTDALLAGTVLIGAATAYVEIRFLWGKRREQRVALSANVVPAGAGVWIQGSH
jgi:hypothetical protein